MGDKARHAHTHSPGTLGHIQHDQAVNNAAHISMTRGVDWVLQTNHCAPRWSAHMYRRVYIHIHIQSASVDLQLEALASPPSTRPPARLKRTRVSSTP
jgi:hypothetical protein